MEYAYEKAPNYELKPNAQQLVAASNAAANKRFAPIEQIASNEIDVAVALGLGYIDAKNTLSKINKCTAQEKVLFLDMLRNTLLDRNITMRHDKSHLYIIWNHEQWDISVDCEKIDSVNVPINKALTEKVFIINKKDGAFGLTINTYTTGTYPSIHNSPSEKDIPKGAYLLEINGKNTKYMSHSSIVSLLNEIPSAEIKIRY